MISLRNGENKIHCEQKVCCICKKRFSTDDGNKKYYKVGDHCHYREAPHSICNLR